MTEKRVNLHRKRYIRITSHPIIPRSYIIGIAFSYALLLLSSCVAPLQLPSEHEVPRQEKLPIDGTWEIQFQSSAGAVFKIEAGRMYVYANYSSRARRGMVVAKNIRQISPLKYVCEYATGKKYTRETSFVSGEIEVLSEDKLRVRYFYNRVRDDSYKKVGLDDDALFLSQLKPKVSQPPKANSIKTTVLGTGWPVQGGYIVTNWHIVQDCSTIVLIRPDGVKIPATLLVRDQANDIALLRTDSLEKLPTALPLASTTPGVGANVFTMGYPHPDVMGIKPKLTDGIINSVYGFQDDPRTYQISVPLQSGNSGGPLLNTNGEVVAIVTSKLSAIKMFKLTGDLPQNVNYAIKIQYVRVLLESLSEPQNHKVLPVKKGTLEELAARTKDSVLMVVVE